MKLAPVRVFSCKLTLWCSGQGVACTWKKNRVRLPATLFSVSFYRFFFFSFCLVLVFNTTFPFGLFSFILIADPADRALGSIYILRLSPFFFLEKGFQELLICMLARLMARKNHKLLTDVFLLLNSWISFNVSWHHDKQHTVHHKQC